VNPRTIRRLLLAVAVTFASASAVLLVAALYNSLAVLTPYRVLYRVAALCGLLLSAVCFTVIARKLHRLRDPVREKNLAIGVLLAVVSSAISVIVLEIGLSVFRPAITYRRARDISPSVFRKSEILPFQLRPGYEKQTYMWESDSTFHYTINSRGYRSPEFEVAKAPGIYRILLLGDSFAINQALPDEEVHTVVLEQRLNETPGRRCRFEVINAGYADGYSPDAYIAYMLNEGFDLDADMVIMQYFVLNDFKDLLETEVVGWRDGLPFRVRSRFRYVDDTGQFRRSNSLRYRIPVLRNSHLYLQLYEAFRMRGVLSVLSSMIVPNYAGDNFSSNSYGIRPYHAYADAESRPPLLQEAFHRSMDHVRALGRETEARGARFVLFVVPTGVQMSREVWDASSADPPPWDWKQPNPQAQIAAALEEDGVEIFDPIEFFRARAEEKTLFLGADRNGHWNREGSAVAAEALYGFVSEALGLPGGESCSPSVARVDQGPP
jgi:hypothetical protein